MADTFQFHKGIKIHTIIKKTIAILVPRSQLEPILASINKTFLFIKIPEYENKENLSYKCHNDHNEFEDEYFLLVLASNEQCKTTFEDCFWSDDIGRTVKSSMRSNIRGSSTGTKHHGSDGEYFGFGIISKYALKENLSINTFAGNNASNWDTRQLLKMQLKILMNNFQNILPLSLWCAFLVTNSMLEICNKYPDDCSNILDVLDENEIDRNSYSCSNWICLNAETREFHQETDSSYTYISVPYWHPKYYLPETKAYNKGTANFVFKWTSKLNTESDSRFLPLEMSDGMNVMFSGFGCYHRQHKTNNGTFWNFASYQNSAFYSKLRMSIIRCIVSNFCEKDIN